MRFLLTVLIVAITHSIAYSQSIVSGNVTDNSNATIPFAAVTLLQTSDSTIVSYSITNNNGVFTISYKPGKYILKVSCLGYITQTKNIILSENQSINVNFILNENIIELEGAVITETNPGIRFAQDTIRFDPKVFTDGTEVNLGEMLNKLPGVEVDEKGGVKAQGKQVENILLNGQDIFSGNTQMATKNLPADIAENVEVLNSYSEYSLLSGFQSHEKTVINVGVNKERLGKISGNITAGGGYNKKYLGKGNIMQINSKIMTSFIGAINNTGDEVFSIEEYISLQGGVNELSGNNSGQVAVSLSKEEQRLLMPKNNTFSRLNGLSALNVAYQPKSSLKINSYFLFNGMKEEAEDMIKYKYILPLNSFEATNQSKYTSNNKLYAGYFKLNFQPSETFNLVYKGNISVINMASNNHALNTIDTEILNTLGFDNAQTLTTKHDITMMKSLGKHLLSANANFSFSNKPATYAIQTDSLLLPLPLAQIDGWYYGQQNIFSQQLDGSLNTSFIYRINSSYFFKTSLNAVLINQKYESEIYDNTLPSELVKLEGDSLQNNLSMNMYDYNAGINFVKNVGVFRFKLGVFAHLYKFYNDLFDSSNNFALNPLAEISLHFSQKNVLSLSFSQSDTPNSPEAFICGTVFNSYQTYSHNSLTQYLYNTKYTTKLTYHFFDMFSNTTVVLTGLYSRLVNSVTNSYYQSGLLTEYQSISSSPGNTLFTRLYVSKGLGFVPWTIILSGGYNINTLSNKSMNLDNKFQFENTSGKLSVTSNYRKKLDFECAAGLEYLKNKSSLGSESTQLIQRYAGKIKMNFAKKFFSYVELEYVINNTIDSRQDLYNLNAGLRYQLSKKWEFEIAGVNMLHLNEQNWIIASYNGIYMSEIYYRQIPGNIMAKVHFKF